LEYLEGGEHYMSHDLFFLHAYDIINESKTISEIIEWKMNQLTNHKKTKALLVHEEKIKRLNADFKKENFDSMTQMKYRRFRTDYQTKQKSILCKKRNELNALEYKYNIDLNNINTISDDEQRKTKKRKLTNDYIINKHKITEKYKMILEEFNTDYRYRIMSVGLKWCYIAYDGLTI